MFTVIILFPPTLPVRLLCRLGLLLCCLAAANGALADYPIEVIELKARTLDEVLPVVRPLVGDDAALTGMGSQLIIKASPAQVAAVRKLLAEIDHPPKRLLITVSNQGEASIGSSGYTGSADIRIGQGQVGINSSGRPVGDSQARIAIHDSDTRHTRSAGQQVQALEGRPAYISAGTQVPVRERQTYYLNGVPYRSDVTRLQEANSGFYVVPRLSGDYVTLEIQQRDDRPAGASGRIDTQHAATTVRARLGEWVELGGIDSSGSGSQGGLGYANRSQERASQQIRLKVECLDCRSSAER
jgi:type II secretory pathway component GspD/PulD (secretin)